MDADQITLTRASGKTQRFEPWVVAPQPEIYYWLLPDDLLPTMYRKARPNNYQGFPQTVNVTTDTETIPMTRAIQEFLYALNPGLLRNKFDDIFDTWSKGSKVRDSANFITGERLTLSLPKLPTDILFGGNVVKPRRVFRWEGGSGIPVGVEVIEIETLDPSNLPDPATLPVYLRHHLTIIHPALYNGRKQVNPFPQLGGRDGSPCYTAIMARSPVYIETARTQRVEYVPNVYNPTW